MSNIIRFPQRNGGTFASARIKEKSIASSKIYRTRRKAFLFGLIDAVWVMLILTWPVLKWILALEAVFHFVRMIYYWHTPGMYAGWTFFAYFALLSAINCFIVLYDPKWLKY